MRSKGGRLKRGFYCSPGEAYDKIARLLGLEHRPSGGAALEAFAHSGDAQRFRFSMPLRARPNCNFSYAGLKTAVRLAIEAEAPGPPTEENRQVSLACGMCVWLAFTSQVRL